MPVVTHFVETLGFQGGWANHMVESDGVFTGEIAGELVDSHYKKSRLERSARELGVPMSATIAIGDGANDIPMLRSAGLSIGYHPKPSVIEHVDIVLKHTGYETLPLFFADNQRG